MIKRKTVYMMRVFFCFYLLLFQACENDIKSPSSNKSVCDYLDHGIYGMINPTNLTCIDDNKDFIRIIFVAKYDTSFCYTASRESIGNPRGRFQYIFTKEKTFGQNSKSETKLLDGYLNKHIQDTWSYLLDASSNSFFSVDTLRHSLGTYDYVVLESILKENICERRIVDVLPNEYSQFVILRKELDSLMRVDLAIEL